MQLYCFPSFSLTLVERSPRGHNISGGLGMGWERLWDLTWVLQPSAGPDAAGPCGAFCLSHSRKPQLLALFFPGPDAILQLPHCALKSIQLLNLSSFMCLPSTEAPGLSPSLLLLLEGCGFFSPIYFCGGILLFSQHSSVMVSHTSRS